MSDGSVQDAPWNSGLPGSSIFRASAPFATRYFGSGYRIHVTDTQLGLGQNLVLSLNIRPGASEVLCRVSSSCLPSTVFSSDDCDCAEQNAEALSRIRAVGRGIFIYLDQEGRGHGLVSKVIAMNGKAAGLDTFEAVESLGLNADARDYDAVPPILRGLGCESVILLTNNPDKVASLRNHDIRITDVQACQASDPPAGSLRHLYAKRDRGHNLKLPN